MTTTAQAEQSGTAIAAWLGRRLRGWAGDAGEWAPLLGWVAEPARTPVLLAALLDTLAWHRRTAWLDFVRQRSDPWASWSPDGLTFTVDVTALAGDGWLRRPEPVAAPDALALLKRLATRTGAGKKRLAELVLQALRRALADQAEAACFLAPLAAFAGVPDGVGDTTASDPTPPALAESLRQFLNAADPALGCLSPRTRTRLFRHGRALAAPWVAPVRFDEALATANALRDLLARQPCAPLAEVCEALTRLGCFAAEVRPVLAGPLAGPARHWARHLCANLQAFARLASCLKEEPHARATNDRPLSTTPHAGEAALEELARRHPAVGQFLALLTHVREARALCAGHWPEAEEAVKSLHYPAERYRKTLLRARPEDQERQVQSAGRGLADDLMNKIHAFDALLPGKSSDGPLPSRVPPHLRPELRQQLGQCLSTLRDQLLCVMRDQGGYDEYPVALGDALAKHGALLEDVTLAATTRHRAQVIFQILEPGYVRHRDSGPPEVIRSAKVCAAR